MTDKSRGALPQFNIPGVDLVLAAAVGIGCLVLYAWLVSPPPPVGFYWDDGWYLMMAEWLSGREEYRQLVWNMLHIRQYPPLYPALLDLFGAGLETPSPGFLINAVAGAASAVCLVLWMRHSEKFPLVVAMAAAVAMILCPMALTWLPAIFSEHVFILQTVIALWLAAVAKRPHDFVVLGILLGIALMTRSAGAALVGAVALTTTIRNWKMLPWLAAGFAPATLAAWWLTSDLPHMPFRQALTRFDLLALFEPARLLEQLRGLARGWTVLWGSSAGGLIAFALLLPGFWSRLRTWRADAWLVPFTVAMLVLWPYPLHMDRYLWPLIPAVLVCAAETTRMITSPRLQQASFALIPLVILLGLSDGVIRSVKRAANPPDPSAEPLSRMLEWTRPADVEEATQALQSRGQLLADMQRVRELTPPGVCIYSELPALLAVQARRISQLSPWNSLAGMADFELTCDFYFLMPLGLPGSDRGTIDQIGEQHEIIYQSPLPWEPDGPIPMGVLFRLERN